MGKNFYAGAGEAKIRFPAGYFPTYEGYVGIHTPMHARTLVIRGQQQAALTSLELPSIRPGGHYHGFRELVSRITGTPQENVWVAVTHSLSAPHTPGQADPAAYNAHIAAVTDAIRASAEEAQANLRPARFGWAMGESDLNVRRYLNSVDGWWVGLTGEGPTDNTLSVLRFDGEDGKPIAMVYNHPVKSCVFENVLMSDGKKYASADLCGEASRRVSEHFGAPALFFMGAGGDSFPKWMGNHNIVGEDGHFHRVNHGEKAYEMLSQLGTTFGNDIIHLAERIECLDECPEIEARHTAVTVPGQIAETSHPAGPVPNHMYIPAEDQTVDLELLRIGDVGVIGVKPEIVPSIMERIRARSPFPCTLLFSMVNGGQNYIGDEEAFRLKEWPAARSTHGRGADGRFVEAALSGLHNIMDKEREA